MAARAAHRATAVLLLLRLVCVLPHYVPPTREPTPEPTKVRVEVGYDSQTCLGGRCTRDATKACVDESPGWVFTFPSGGNSTCFGLCYSSVNRAMFANRTSRFTCETAVDSDLDAALQAGGVCRACRSNCYEACLPFPTAAPTAAPSETFRPSKTPTSRPSPLPSASPYPTEAPSEAPSEMPSPVPKPAPTSMPYPEPSEMPLPAPTYVPTPTPTPEPSGSPSYVPTSAPTVFPGVSSLFVPPDFFPLRPRRPPPSRRPRA